jgi:hypothetical protein
MQEKGISLRVHCGSLHYRDPNEALTGSETEFLREREHEIVLEAMRTREPFAATSARTIPLTFQQEFALEHCGNSFYGVFAARLCGSLNCDALSRGVQALFERHGALRTSIAVTEMGLYQHVNPVGRRDVKLLDLQVTSVQRASVDIDSCVGALVREWLDVATSAFAVKLLKVSGHEHVLIVFWDHLFSDHVSGVLLFQELWNSYRSASRQQVDTRQGLPMQYSDYSIWQRQAYASWSERHDNYWKERLSGVVPVQMPAASDSTSPLRDKAVQILFGEPLSSSLRDIGRRVGIATSFVIVSLVALAMSAWSGQRKFAVPMPFSGRCYRKHLDVVGYLANFLPLRIDLESHGTFGQLCNGVSREFLTGVAHLDLGKTVDGGMSEILRGPYIQWFPSDPTNEAIAPAASTWNIETLGLSVEPFAGQWKLPNRGRGADFPGGLAFWEGDDGGIVGVGFLRFAMCAEARVGRFAPDLILLASQVTADPSAQVTSLIASLETD